MDASILSIEDAKLANMIITGKKEYIYSRCVDCVHSYFAVAVGLNPHYGWYIQCCSCSHCEPVYRSIQLTLNL